MSEIMLFRVSDDLASEVSGSASDLEKPLQTMIERNLETFFKIRFLASEYSTGKTHAGRIDTLGIDENNSPVIIEYKRSLAENVINQGLFYLDWLMDHQAEFTLLVMKALGHEAGEAVDWSAPRLLCIAADFTKYDGHAIQQMNRNIELVRYRRFGPDLLLFELVNAVAGQTISTTRTSKKKQTHAEPPVPMDRGATEMKRQGRDRTVEEWMREMKPSIREIFGSLEEYIFSLGDDVQRKDLKLYIAFKRLKNFATVVFHTNRIDLFLHLDPDTVVLEVGFSRSVRNSGHWGTGDLQVSIASMSDLKRAKEYLRRAYDGE